MRKIKFHTIAAFVVFIVAAAWVLTGEFAAVGSHAEETTEGESATTAPEGADAEAGGSGGGEAAEAEAEQAATALKTVAVVTPQIIEHNRIVRISGLTMANKRTTLATRSAGVISELNVEKGDHVSAGDVILTLEGPEKAAAVARAEALLVQRQQEFDNAAALVERGINPETQTNAARSALAAARAELEAAQAELDRLNVVAPFDGIVDSVEVEQASWAQAGDPVGALLQIDPLRIRGEVSEADRRHIEVGTEADVRLINGVEATGKVSYISLDATPETRTYPVEIQVSNPDRQIPVGMTAEIMLKAPAVKAVKLPRSVVTLNEEGDLGVRTLDRNERVGFVAIDLIDDTPSGLILGGIDEDARVIVAGQDLVTTGDVVNAVEAGRDMLAGVQKRPTQ